MFRQFIRQFALIVVIAGASLSTLNASAQRGTNAPSTQVDHALRARKIFVEAKGRYHSDTNNVEAAWQYARACFDLGEFAATSSDRAEVAEIGIAVARQLVARHPNSAEGHYYLAMNMGQLARTKSLGALRLVDLMEAEFNTVRRLNEKFDYAGSWRNLGQLYLEAPAFGSIGSRSKARQHLRKAVELAPDYPENRLLLAEAYLRWGDETAAAREFRILASGWEQAKSRFKGEHWAMSWIDWQKRFTSLKQKLGDAVSKLETPKADQ